MSEPSYICTQPIPMELLVLLPVNLQTKIYDYYIVVWFEDNKKQFQKQHYQLFRYVLQQWDRVLSYYRDWNWDKNNSQDLASLLKNYFEQNKDLQRRQKYAQRPDHFGKSSHELRRLDGRCVKARCLVCNGRIWTKSMKKSKGNRKHSSERFDDVISFVEDER
jgi:hypothetical protein